MILDTLIEKSIPFDVLKKIREMPSLNEIRLRKDCPFCLVADGKNYVFSYVTTKKEIDQCINILCKNSVHTYYEFINQGYIPTDNGYKVGVCGKAVLEKKNIINISEITGINIRVPAQKVSISSDFLAFLPYSKGLLVYSAPNVGKTTFLKCVAAHLSLPPYNKKVCVVDCKNEIYSDTLHKKCPIDFFIGYPKYEAIEMAVRNMSPDFIICDEIGLTDDVTPLIECKNSGVSVICSAHADTLNDLVKRKNILEMQTKKTFGGYVGIKLEKTNRRYTFTDAEEIQ